MKTAFLAFSLLAWLVPALSGAEKVKLDVKVVEASNQGAGVDPKVAHLERDLNHGGTKFSSYKLISATSPTVDFKQDVDVPLPNGMSMKITPLEHEKDGKVKVHLQVAKMIDETISIPNKGRHTIGAGSKDHGKASEGQIFVVVIPTAE